MTEEKKVQSGTQENSLEQALQVLNQEKRDREQQCVEEVNKICAKYKCSLKANVVIIGDQISSQVLIHSN